MPIGYVPFVWAEVTPLLKKALDREGSGRYEIDDILKLLLEGTARLWIAHDPDVHAIKAAVVTQIVQFPRKRELRIWLIGGSDMHAWAKQGLEMVEAFARSIGCFAVTGGMRRGWMRIGDGYKDGGVMLEKRL